MKEEIKDGRGKRGIYIIIGIVIVVLVIGGYFIFSGDGEFAGEIESLRLGVYEGEFSSLIFIADEKGFFEDYGLDVDMKKYDSGVKPMQALLGGEVDVVTSGEFVAVNFISGNDNIRVFSVIDEADAIELIVKKDRVSRIEDLPGSRIGLKKGSQAEYFLDQFLVFSELNSEDVEVVDMNPLEMKDALDNGEVDGVMVWDPFTSNIKDSLGDDGLAWNGQSGQEFYFLVSTSSEFISESPEAIKRFLKSLIKAEKFVNENDGKAMEVVKDALGYDEGYINSVWEKSNFKVDLPQSLILAMESEGRWKILDTGDDMPNYLDYIYTDALKEIDEKRVTIIG
jgi:NitT/TauT family transport system substrate-binding protein